ncbi:uncharacterized protein Triagg1_2665 [Trichoderma aggressivum f. europaeum]|uniref:Uncharacterized protein n=1 Tax=Trichoderma aggressivum f. europaeum TaxID=173218 RepID=A0AAE1M1R7_9HYPO|nr:hypothetical protein Triagg1_2665 [Trichoderma aggressivum f. europaeum]
MPSEGSMELLRSELLRRARGEQRGSTTQDRNQNEVLASRRQTIMREMNTSHKFPRRLLLPHLALGRRRAGDEEAALESPKTPVLPSRRSNSPPVYRMSMARPGGLPVVPQPAVLAASDARRAALETMNSEVRDEQPRPVKQNKPKRFLFCLPWIKSRHVRAQLAMCFVAAVFLFSLLAVYLGLTLTKHVVIGELNIMLIMIILLAGVFFCYSLIRLWMLVVRGDPPDIPRAIDPRGYAVPRNPIRVVMAQDEEAAGAENEAMTMKPPAYGLWRESVRVDPNRFFWQRNDAEPTPPPPTAGPRPPSYISEDGVSYVVDAVPRSIAPSSEGEHQPVHPSERGRAGLPPAS